MDRRVKPGNDADLCPGRDAAFFTLLRRTGTVPNTRARYGPALQRTTPPRIGALARQRRA